MPMLMSVRGVDPRRWLLASVLGLVAAVLIAGGAQLATLGGSLYYLIAGILLAAAAYFVAQIGRAHV